MPVDKETVRRIASLARIRIDEEELEPMAAELSSILEWIDQLNAVETADVAPMTSVEEMPMKKRPDEVVDGNRVEDILANAPMREGNFFVVPKVVE